MTNIILKTHRYSNKISLETIGQIHQIIVIINVNNEHIAIKMAIYEIFFLK